MVWPAADRVIFATVRRSFFAPETFSVPLSLAYDNHGGPTNGQHTNRSKFICCALRAGLQFLGWRSRERRNCRDQGRYDYQAGASARRGVEIRRRVGGWEPINLQCRPTSNRQLGRALAMMRLANNR